MKQLTLVVRPFRAEAVLRALDEAGLSGVVRDAKGYSRQKSYLERYLGSEFTMAFLPKVEITVFVPDERVESIVEHIARTARTGRMGDGKIFVLPLAWEPIEF